MARDGRDGRGAAVASWAAIVLLAGISAGLGWWLGLQREAANVPPLPDGVVVVEPGQPVPAWRLPSLATGQPVPVVVEGRPRLLNYWASWCGPCREEMPMLDAFAAAEGPNGVEVVGIALEPAADARAFLAQVPVGFPQLQETPGPADSSVRLGNRRGLLPFSALVGADGRLLKVHVGPFASEADIRAWATAP
jgi:thiol-disulfide isomerase/thioredoxin